MYSLESLDLPAVIGTDEGAGWTKTKSATWSQMVASALTQRRELRALAKEADAFDAALDVLRPVMKAHPTMCVAEAFAVLDAQVTA
jgi:hypothetical protein